MKIRLLILAIAASLVGIGCAPRYSITVAGPRGEAIDAESVIQEVVVRNLAARESAGEVVFVAFGESRLHCADPPEGFFARLDSMDVRFAPVSRYDRLANPNAPLLVLGRIGWTTETEATVSVTRVRFGVDASDGLTAWVVWKSGVWKIAKSTRHWST